MLNLRVIKEKEKYWLAIGGITFGAPFEDVAAAEQTKTWFLTAMPKVIKHIEDQQLKKWSGKIVDKCAAV